MIPVHKKFKIQLRRQKNKTVYILPLNNVNEVQKKGTLIGSLNWWRFRERFGNWPRSWRMVRFRWAKKREGNGLSCMLSPWLECKFLRVGAMLHTFINPSTRHNAWCTQTPSQRNLDKSSTTKEQVLCFIYTLIF